MSAAKDSTSTRQSAHHTRSVANNVHAAANSMPAVPVKVSEQLDEKTEERDTVQLKLSGHAGADASADPGSPGNPNNGKRPAQFKTANPPATQLAAETTGPFKPVQKKENKTGLPDNLKSGIENMSGFDMSDVKVHYNSPQPAQLQALAYAQGTDIHVAPGQEKHVPHEAWHVVQQKQGRVKPTIQMKQGVPVNDDRGLEQEADVMGAKALQQAQDTRAVQREEIAIGNPSASPVQMKRVSIIGVKIGKTRIYNRDGTAVGHIAKGTQIDIDEGTTQVAGSRTLVKITSGGQGIIWNNPEALLNDSDNLWISNTRYTSVEEEAAADEGEEAPSVTVPFFGQELKIGKDSAELSGSVEQEVDFKTPDVSLSFDFPLPAPAPVYVTVGLDVGLNFKLGVNGSYTITASGSGQKVNVNLTANGTAGMDIDVHVGAGMGVANLGGFEGGLFAGASSEFAVEGALSGEITKDAAKEWAASTLQIKLKSAASLVGKAGAYIKAKILNFSKEKKFTLLEKEFAKWEYERTRSIQKAGVRVQDIIPTVADFKMMLAGHEASEFSVAEDVSDTTPLLGSGSGPSSDD